MRAQDDRAARASADRVSEPTAFAALGCRPQREPEPDELDEVERLAARLLEADCNAKEDRDAAASELAAEVERLRGDAATYLAERDAAVSMGTQLEREAERLRAEGGERDAD